MGRNNKCACIRGATYYGTGLSLNISSTDNSLEFELAQEVAPYFRIADTKAQQIIANTKNVVSTWKKLANKYQIPVKEQDLMSPAFEKIS